MNQAIIIEQLLFRQYISLYVQKHTLNQDYFICLCQHQIIGKLFGPKARILNSISILQIFNLLLANTNQINSLVYILSQKQLHEYLFNKFNIYKESGQSIQYYVQLLKTIILKISSQKNNSLIKMFCNNRYPSFPLLTAVTSLATTWNSQCLVRVTAQQCVLQLINLINQKQIGRGYLTDLQMAVFFHEITYNLNFNKQSIDNQGALKYIIDIVYALRNNKTSLELLMNALTNNYIVTNINSLGKILHLIHTFMRLIKEQQNFPTELSSHLKNSLFNIIRIIYFSRFLNSTFYASLKIIPDIKNTEKPNLFKYFDQRGEKISAYLLQYDNFVESQANQRQKLMLFQNWKYFNSNNTQIQKLKNPSNQKTRLNAGIFGLFFPKASDKAQQYIKNVMLPVGLSYQNLKFPLYKLTATINYKTCLYILQLIIAENLQNVQTGQGLNRQDYDMHLNDIKYSMQINKQAYQQMLQLIQKLEENNVPLEFQFKKHESKSLQSKEFKHAYLPEYLFLSKFRQYLASNHIQKILTSQQNQLKTIEEVLIFHEIFNKLQIGKLLDKKIKQKVLEKIQETHQDINDITFSHSDFKGLIDYIYLKKSDKFKIMIDQQEGCKIDICSKIEEKTFYFQFLSRLIDPNISSLYDFVAFQWYNIKSKDFTLLLEAKIIDVEENRINIELDIENGFALKYKSKNTDQKNVKTLDIRQSTPKMISDNNKWYIVFDEKKQQCFQMKSKLDAEIMISQIERIRSSGQEIITKLIVHYFEITYNSLREMIYHN